LKLHMLIHVGERACDSCCKIRSGPGIHRATANRVT